MSMRATSPAVAIAAINNSKLGLTGGVFTRDARFGRDFVAALDVGAVYVNASGLVEPCMPWSGRKDSGVGGILSVAGLRHNFARTKAAYFA